MTRFIDIEDKAVFDGSHPYVFWFDGNQSIGLYYSKTIIAICDSGSVKISIPENGVFTLADPSRLAPKAELKDISVNEYDSTGTQYGDLYIHIIYVICRSDIPGEYIDSLYIGNDTFSIGAGFFGEDESLKINMSNFGINIPDSIQKAIYEGSLYGDNIDYILMNRKWKELLSNYWNMIANKGSYKSLINSLKWFEWPDVDIHEVWRDIHSGGLVTRSISDIMDDIYSGYMQGFAKTTYISLYKALNRVVSDQYDSEKNPVLENITLNMTRDDMMLKMSMLGSFYEAFFMPIHLDLLDATVYDIVFTNTFKTLSGTLFGRNDEICNHDTVLYNSEDVYISDVYSEVSGSTVFGDSGLCVDPIGSSEIEGDRDEYLRRFYSHGYRGIGSIAPIICMIPSDTPIKHTSIDIYNGDDVRSGESFNVIYPEYYRIKGDIYQLYEFKKNNECIEVGGALFVKQKPDHPIYGIRYIMARFNVLLISGGEHHMSINFETSDSIVHPVSININVHQPDTIPLSVYKVEKYPIIKQDMIDKNYNLCDYIYTRYIEHGGHNDVNAFNILFKNTDEWSSVGLNNLIVLTGEYSGIENDFDNHIIYKRVSDDTVYTICINMSPWISSRPEIMNKYKDNIFRNELIFVPQFHKIVPITSKSIDTYLIRNEAVFVVPQMPLSMKLESYEWKFYNVSTGRSIDRAPSSKEPYVAHIDETGLERGFYDIYMKYKLADGKENESVLKSAFIKL